MWATHVKTSKTSPKKTVSNESIIELAYKWQATNTHHRTKSAAVGSAIGSGPNKQLEHGANQAGSCLFSGLANKHEISQRKQTNMIQTST